MKWRLGGSKVDWLNVPIIRDRHHVGFRPFTILNQWILLVFYVWLYCINIESGTIGINLSAST